MDFKSGTIFERVWPHETNVLEAPGLSASVDKNQLQTMAAKRVHTGEKCDTIFGLLEISGANCSTRVQGERRCHTPLQPCFVCIANLVTRVSLFNDHLF